MQLTLETWTTSTYIQDGSFILSSFCLAPRSYGCVLVGSAKPTGCGVSFFPWAKSVSVYITNAAKELKVIKITSDLHMPTDESWLKFGPARSIYHKLVL